MAGVLGNPLGYKGVLTSRDDVNNLSDGIYNIVNANSPSNVAAENAILIQFTHKERTDCYQLLFEANKWNVQARMFNTYWSSWKVLFAFK